MSGTTPVAFWGLKVSAGDELTMVASELPGVQMFHITMAAIDPNADAPEGTAPFFATLKLVRRPLGQDDFQYSDEEDESESEDEVEMKKIQQKAKKVKKQAATAAAAKGNKMDVEGESDEEDDSDDDEPFETEEFVICTLNPDGVCQQPLDIVIGEYEEAFFKATGGYDIFLTGNYIVPAEDVNDSDEDSDEEDYDLPPDEDELADMLGGDADSGDELDDVENPRIIEVASEDDDEKEKKEDTKPAKKKLTKAEKKRLKRAAEEEAKSGESKKPTKKQKANDGKVVAATPDAAESAKKQVQFAKPIEQGPTDGQKATKKAPEKTEPKDTAKPKVVQGVTIEDKKIGTGPAAKNGNKLGMRYIGKLSNGKRFDSNVKGKAFTFRLGKGEVIKGWDVGLAGMQVGGERRIVIPPGMAYGNKSLAGIPPNSTLTFDVKLLEIK